MKKIILLYGLLLTAIFLVLLFSVASGQTNIPFADVFHVLWANLFTGDMTGVEQSIQSIVWQIRLPHALMAFIVGSGLALCGTILQAAVRNPLADPYILGISSGASLGATFAILIGVGQFSFLSFSGVSAFAFLGAVLASATVLLLAEIGRTTTTKLLLSGMIVQAICSAFASFIIYFAQNAQGMSAVIFWTMGSLAGANYPDLALLYVLVPIVALFFLTQTRTLDVLLLGEAASITLGINLGKMRRIYLLIAALLTGVIVSFSGVIGFVGLLVPHIVRGIVGSSHKHLLPVSILSGGLFLIVADMLARSLISQAELPIGIVTAMIGAPIMLLILLKKEYRFGGI